MISHNPFFIADQDLKVKKKKNNSKTDFHGGEVVLFSKNDSQEHSIVH